MPMNHNRGDVYLVLYPFEDNGQEKIRPGIILHTHENQSLVIKVTSHEERDHDPKDVALKYWREAGLSKPSVARCGKVIPLVHSKIREHIGTLHPEDLLAVCKRQIRDRKLLQRHPLLCRRTADPEHTGCKANLVTFE